MESKYEADHYDLAFPDGAEQHWWHLARNRIILDTYRGFGDGGHALDIGCGRGIAVQYLRAHGVDCRGVEIALPKPLAGMEHYIRVGTSAFELPATERERVSTAMLLDVIEHLAEPLAFLGEIVASFANLKYLIIAVPARQELWSNHDEFYGHFRRYDLEGCRKVGEALSAEPLRVSYFFHALYPPVWVGTKMGAKRNVALTPPRPGVQWLHNLAAAAFVTEYRLVPRAVPGTSIIAAFRVRR